MEQFRYAGVLSKIVVAYSRSRNHPKLYVQHALLEEPELLLIELDRKHVYIYNEHHRHKIFQKFSKLS